MTTRWARVARGFVAAAVSLFAAAAFHIIVGGTIPTVLAIACCLVASTFVCVGLSGKKLSLPKLSAAVGVSQFLFHSVFSMWTAQPAIGMSVGHMHDQLLVFLPQAGSAVSADPDMWLAHGLAAAVTIAALRHGEAAFWGLLVTARLWLGTIVAKVVLVLPARTSHLEAPVLRVELTRELLLLLSSLQHRGPPTTGIPVFGTA